MKTKILLFATLFFLSLNLFSQTIAIPDTNFEQALIDLGWDSNGLNGNILISEAQVIDSLNIQDPENNTLLPNVSAKIVSLEGIEEMVNLKSLEAGNNELTSVDLSQNTALTNLFLNDNQLTSIDVSKNTALERFGIMRNQISSVDVSILPMLKDLFVHGNQLTSIDVSNNTNLTVFYALDNLLTSLDVTQNTLLEMLRLENNYELQPNNQISTLDLSNNINLKDLRFSNNPINAIDLSNNVNLEFITFYGVNLSSIDVSQNTKLKRIYAGYNNNLTSIDVSANLDLEWLIIINNNFTSIDVSNNTKLQSLTVDNNSLSAIDVTNNPELYWLSFENNAISTIDISNNSSLTNLYLNGNDLTSLDVSNNLLLGQGDPQYDSVVSLNDNPNLTCIQIDATQNTTNWTKDDTATYSTNCGGENTIVTIPDTNFEQALIDLGWDSNGLNGNILISEAQVIDSLNIQDPENNPLLPNVSVKIKSLQGIEAMPNLVSLESGNNELTSVDLSQNTALTNLFLNDNQLTSIDVSNNKALERFGVMRNQLTTIDVSMLVNLVDLFVHENQIISLDVTNNTELNWLFTSNNQLSAINLSHNTKLKRIDIYWNSLTTIDVSMLADLEDLRVGSNQLTQLDISNNSSIYNLSCDNNQLDVLNVKNGNNSNFTYFSANNNANLACIQVDDVSFSTANWELIDATATFNTDCNIPATVSIPDYNMKTALVADNTINSNGDTEIQVSEAEAVTGTITLEALDIDNLTGIAAFKNITGLNVSENNLTTVDLSNNTKLSYLSIYTNQLTALDITFLASLEFLYAGSNQITEIDVTNNLFLKRLWLNINNISALDISKNSDLEELELDWNYNLSAIDFSNNLKLYRIHLWKTAISTIDVSQLVDLQRLYVSETNLKTIDISNNIKLYDFRSTDNPEIPTYDFSNNTALNRIDLSNSNVSDVDVSNNINLTQLLLAQNNLTSVDISKNTLLQEIYLNNNKLENIDISKNASVTKLFLNDNLLERAYLKNGNNTAIMEFDITNNANLSCIAVDDVTFSANNWTSIDESVNFSTGCSTEWEVYTEDENLAAALLTVAGLDTNVDGVITYEEAQEFTGDLDLSGQNIISVIGLEAFSNAASIDVSGNSITDISSFLNGESVILSSKSTEEKRVVNRTSTGIKVLNVANNLIEKADISNITSITDFDISNNKLTYLNLNNDSNSSLTTFSAIGNPSLTCIQVDDVAIATANTNWQKDTTANYSTDCAGAALSTDSFLKENIVIYPNPILSNIQISLSNSIQLQSVEIYNLMGKKLLQSKKELINVENFSTGVYFLKISTDKGVLIKKVIKD